jgi:hypothetical protein
MMLRMRLSRSIRKVRHGVEDTVDFATQEGRIMFRNVGLVSAGITALAVGVVVGRELRSRYKFNRRTPYDVYAHAGESNQEVEFGVGT